MLESEFKEYFSTVKVLSDHEIKDDEELNIDEVFINIIIIIIIIHYQNIQISETSCI